MAIILSRRGDCFSGARRAFLPFTKVVSSTHGDRFSFSKRCFLPRGKILQKEHHYYKPSAKPALRHLPSA